MPRCKKLHEKAKNDCTSLRYAELVKLAECWGFELARGTGSHRVYKNAERGLSIAFVEKGKAAKPYNVRELLGYIAEIEQE